MNTYEPVAVPAPLCVDCGGPVDISKTFIEALSKFWHPSCYKCTRCKAPLKPHGTLHECYETNLPICAQCDHRAAANNTSTFLAVHTTGSASRGGSPAVSPARSRGASPAPHHPRNSHQSSAGVSVTSSAAAARGKLLGHCHKCEEKAYANDSWRVIDAALKPRVYHRICLPCDGCGEHMMDDAPVEYEGLHVCKFCCEHLQPEHTCSEECPRQTTCCIERE